LIAVAAGAALLLLLPTGFIGPVFVFGGGLFFVLFAFHYLVWGRLVNLELQESDQPPDEPAN
jgi:hypothetical protein